MWSRFVRAFVYVCSSCVLTCVRACVCMFVAYACMCVCM